MFPCYKAAPVALALGLPDLYSIVTSAGGTTVHPVNIYHFCRVELKTSEADTNNVVTELTATWPLSCLYL